MAETLLTFGVQKLWDLLARESERFQGFDEQFNKLKRDLNLLRAFLEDADAKKHTNKMVKTCVEEIKEIVFDAEDIIETFLLKKELGQASGIWKRMRRLSCIVVDRRNIGSDIGGISERISQVTGQMQSFGVQQMIVEDRKYSHLLQERQREMRKTFPTNYENDLVGLEENVKKLVGYLVEEDNIQVVSITGMGGIGKTTLARQVFNHEMVKNHFDGVAWVCISQEFTRTYVWHAILQQLSSKHNEQIDSNMTEDMLQKKLSRLLETTNSLIVLDDMWKEEDWDRIQPGFPSMKGWKVLLTSRNEKVSLRADPSCVNICINSVYHILSLSFEELPIYLKQCFLYLAHFPEDYTIDVEILSYYWAAERIPRPRHYDGATIREVADGYIEELVKRNMVISKRDDTTLRFETCQLHDIMREGCLQKAEEDNFVETIDSSTVTSTSNSQSRGNSRRLGIHLSDDTFQYEEYIMNPKLRSLLVIKKGFYYRSRWMASGLCFTRLQLMRILDLSDVKFEGGKLPSDIGKLIHLRYLSLYQAEVNHLPSSIRNLRKLLYLNLDVKWFFAIYMPNIMKEMRELTYLYLPEEMHDKTKLELGNLVNLETLKNFSTENSNVSDLQRMTKLRSLSIYIRDKGCATENLSASLSKLIHLEDLTIDDYTNNQEGFVLKCIHLKKLRLNIYIPKLPEVQYFPSHLTTISLKYCLLEEDPMPILEKLLQLKVVYLYGQSFIGRRMVCSRGGFPQLQELELHGLDKWEEWIVEEGSMPLLQYLEIRECPMLKEFPNCGFPQLQRLEVYGLDEWEEWIVEEGSMPFLHILTIWNCPKLKDPMPILAKLLQLKEVRLLYNPFCGRRMVCSGGGFPQLQDLSIWGLKEWEEWIVEEGSMPLLHTLTIWDCPKLKEFPNCGFPQLQWLEVWGVKEWEEWIVEEGSMPLLQYLYIRDCPKLKELPDGLRFIYSLKELKMEKEWKERLSKGGEDYYKVKHIPSIILK